MFAVEYLPYNQTNAFSKIALDYLSNAEELRPFYSHRPTLEGIKKTIEEKKGQPVNRKVLVEVLKEQYQQISTTDAVKKNIESLLSENTFTICTAHQPNLFTGPLYFIYKILHTIKLAAYLKKELPQYH